MRQSEYIYNFVLLMYFLKHIPGGEVRPVRAADHSPPSSAAIMEE